MIVRLPKFLKNLITNNYKSTAEKTISMIYNYLHIYFM